MDSAISSDNTDVTTLTPSALAMGMPMPARPLAPAAI